MQAHMSIRVPWESALRSLQSRLDYQGFAAQPTFDLQKSRRSLRRIHWVPCPEHGLRRCGCQYVVVQISRSGYAASTVILQGSGSSTRLTLLTPARTIDGPGIAAALRKLSDPLGGRRNRRLALTTGS